MNTHSSQTSFHTWTRALPPGLRHLLALELKAGNRVAFVAGTGPDRRTAVVIVLLNPFHRGDEKLPEGISYHENEHEWWDSEYRTGDASSVLAAPLK
jgi:hypothetical protein